MRCIALADVMGKGTAAIGFAANCDIHPKLAKNAHRAGVDPGIKCPLRTASQQDDPPPGL